MDQATDVAIIGGGVIGCAIAYYLRKLGRDVTVFDRGLIGGEASSAAAGLLAPLGHLAGPGPFTNLLLASHALFPALVDELEEASGVRVDYERSGTFYLLQDSEDAENFKARLQGIDLADYHLQWLTGAETCKQEPLLHDAIYGALYVPEEAIIRPAYLVKAFVTAATRAGARFVEHTEITGIERQGAKVTAVRTNKQTLIHCRHVVFTAGAWGAMYGKLLDLTIPVSPLRGQILTLHQPATPLRHIVFDNDFYLAPRPDGTVVVGATREQAGFEKHLTAGGIAHVLATAIRLAPQLAQAEIDQMWLGLRPCSPDGQPILGPVDCWENVTVATGHSGLGILLSPITGQSIAHLIATGDAPEIICPFALSRFVTETP
ncbi:MAG TPA: glycine oxidase ThiO [Ktedonobacteraceae bacterium]|jgi:glycine oxidase|nr:glycine oxidase ThiO [Ktedonobacteraceae bacterium]